MCLARTAEQIRNDKRAAAWDDPIKAAEAALARAEAVLAGKEEG